MTYEICHHRAAQRREQAWEQLVSPSQEELSSTIGRQLMETLPCTMKVGRVQRFQFRKNIHRRLSRKDPGKN